MTNIWDDRINEILKTCAAAEKIKDAKIRKTWADHINELITRLNIDVTYRANTWNGLHVGQTDALNRAVHALITLDEAHSDEGCEICERFKKLNESAIFVDDVDQTS